MAFCASPWGQEDSSGAQRTFEQWLAGGMRGHWQEEQELGTTGLSRDSPIPEDGVRTQWVAQCGAEPVSPRVTQLARLGLNLQSSCLSLRGAG